jgi:hypothetical protein
MNIQSIVVFVLIVVLAAPLAMAAPRQEPPEVWQAFARKLEAGAYVEVHLKDGTKVKGNFIPASEDVFRLKPKTRIAVPIRDLQFSDIESIDRKHEGFWSPGMKVLVGTGIAVGAAVLILVAAYARG